MPTQRSFVLRSATWLRAFALLAAAGSFAVLAQAPAKLDKAALTKYVVYLERWPADAQLTLSDPKDAPDLPGFQEVLIERTRLGRVVAQRRYFLSKDGQRFFKADVFQLSEPPYEAIRQRLSKGTWPSFGPADAPVTLIEFADLQCPDCAAETKIIRELLPVEFPKQVQVQFRDYPLVQHHWAMNASIAGRCVFQSSPALFWDYSDWVYAHQKEITESNFQEKLGQWSKDKKLDSAFETCVAQRSTEADVKKSIANGLALEVPGTPTLFLNGRMVPMDTDWPTLKWMIDYELKTTMPGESCCLVDPR